MYLSLCEYKFDAYRPGVNSFLPAKVNQAWYSKYNAQQLTWLTAAAIAVMLAAVVNKGSVQQQHWQHECTVHVSINKPPYCKWCHTLQSKQTTAVELKLSA